MRKIFTLLSIALTSFSLASQAQTSAGKAWGKVQDGAQKTVESATIALLKTKDSSIVKVAAADKEGKYTFENIKDGSYLVSVTAVGHTKGFSKSFDVNAAQQNVEVATIMLVPDTKAMAGVTVTARRPLIEQKIDRTIVNVDASPTNVGSSALEVLEKSPGLSVDKDGNISLKGKQGVLVLVDGRPTQLGGADLANLLRSMNASQLDQIEIMTNPPAKYDAAGNAGVINIKTKKTKQMGYNGSVNLSYGQGYYPKYNEGITFNYRAGKVNLFTSVNHNYRKSRQNLDIQRKFRNDDKEITSYFDQEARMKNTNNSFNAKIGADYFAGKNTTFGVVFSGITAPGHFENRNNTLIYDAAGELDNNTKALSISDGNFKNLSTNLNFRQVLDTAGKEITADLDYITYHSQDRNNLSNYYFNPDGSIQRKGDTLYGFLPQEINIWSGKVDYVHPLKKGARFEAGIKSSFVKTDNNANYDTLFNGQVIHDYNRSNYFIYEENINAAYANLSTPLSKKINAQLGLRLENTLAVGKQMTTGENFRRPYTNLFPTAFFQYTIDKKNVLGLNYGKRIRRPNYESLNPFIEFLDRYTYQQGNPNLKPQFSHNIELSHTYKNFLTTTLNYTKTTDIIQQVIEQNTEKKETFVRQANIARQRQFGLSVNANMPVTKWWTSSIYANVSNNRFQGVVSGADVTVDATYLMLNGSQQFKFAKTWGAEISGFYRTKGVEGVIMTRPMGTMQLGFSKQVMKNKGTVRLNVRDVFQSQVFKATSKYGNVDAAFQESRDSRVVNLGFTYRFNKGKMGNTPKRKTGGASDEQSRVGGGN